MSESDTPARPVLPSEATDFVTLRELEQRLASLQRLFDERTRYEREILSTRENLLKDSLELASVETKRRLDELNHSRAEARENWQTSLPREVFESYLHEYRTWRDSVNTDRVAYAQLGPRLIDLAKRLEKTEEDLADRLEKTEEALHQATGALVLIRFMGFAGVIALLVSFLRMARMIP